MTYEQTVAMARKFLDSSEALETIGSRIGQFASVLSMIDGHVIESSKIKVGSVQATSDQITTAKANVEFLKMILLELPITKGLGDFSFSFCNIVGNWLNNCAPGERGLSDEVRFVQRFIQYHLTSKEMLEILPVMMQKIRAIAQIGFPSVQLATHYLAVLDEENKKEAANAICMDGDPGKGLDNSKG